MTRVYFLLDRLLYPRCVLQGRLFIAACGGIESAMGLWEIERPDLCKWLFTAEVSCVFSL